MKNKISIVCLFFAIIFLLSAFFCMNVTNAEENSSAKSMCVMETSTNRVLYSKSKNTLLPMASTTKIMTAITAIEACADLDEKFEISKKAVGVSGTSIYLKENEVFSTRDLLYGLMLVSGNDASVAIGEHVGGTVENFVEMMNLKARELGAYNTHFDNTHGLDSKTHFTTAYDLALITSHALENEIFREIVSTKNCKITNADGKTRYLKNKNKLLFSLDGCCGVKTGYTDDAGRCLVSACERDGMRVVSVVLNCQPMFEESKELLTKAFNEYKMVDLTTFYSLPKDISVVEGKSETVPIETKGHFFYPLKETEKELIEIETNIDKNIIAPVNKGEEVGEIKIFFAKNLLFSEKIYTMKEVRRKSIWTKVKRLIDEW